MPKIAQREKEFLERRAAQHGNEKKTLIELTGNPKYRTDEYAMLGNFIDPYMGKIYKGDYFYELLSTGIEKIFFRRYNEKEDLDFDAFIIGLLLGV